MKNSKLFRYLIITIVSLPIALLLLAWLVNLPVFDEELLPEVASIALPTPMPPVENNAYFAMWGISTSSDKNMAETGLRLVERYRDNRTNGTVDTLTADDYAEILGTDRPDEAWLEDFNCTARTTYGCLADGRDSLQSISINSPRAQLMLDRHQQILLMPIFQNWNGSSFTSPIPPYWTTLKLSQLKLARMYDSNLPASFLRQLAIDMRFWKMMLADGSELIDKMFGIAGIWMDIQFLSEYLTRHKLSADEYELALTLVQALTNDELNIAEAFIFEQRVLFNTLSSNARLLPDFGPLVSPWLIQENATQNAYYQYITQPVVHLSGLSGADFFEQTPLREQKTRGRSDAHGREAFENMTRIWPGTPFNLGGKVLLSKLLGYPADYVARVHDLNSMISMIKFQLTMQSKDVDAIEFMVSDINSDEMLLATMLAGKKLTFDKKNGWLQFDCQYQRSVCKIKLY